jgi:hypothetical protein
MKRLTAKEIKKVVYGVVLSDGHIDVKNQRFDFYSKCEAYAQYVYDVLTQITGMDVKLTTKFDKRGHVGYRVFTRKHAYWKNLGDKTYNNLRKSLTKYNVSRLDGQSLANIWMSDGYLERNKNRKKNKIQNIGYICFEAFTESELIIFQKHLLNKFGIESTFKTVRWGHGLRVRIGGESLQKFISLIYPHILDTFKYKTHMYYKTLDYVDMSLPSAEHFIYTYDEVDDIVLDN